MPQTPHLEKHFMGSQTIRDIVTGMSDTCPTAGAGGLTEVREVDDALPV